MSRRLLLPGLLLAVALLPARAQGQFAVGPIGAFHDDFDFGVGAVVMFPLESLHESLSFMGDFTYFFPGIDNLSYFEINPGVIFEFPLEDSSILPFAMGGLNIARISFDFGLGDLGEILPGFSFDTSSTEIGLNIGGGIKFGSSNNLIAGARVELGGGEGFVIFGAFPFPIGA